MDCFTSVTSGLYSTGVNSHSKLLYDAYDEIAKRGKCETKEFAEIFQELSSNSTPMMLLKLWTTILANAFEIADGLSKKVTLKEYQVGYIATGPFLVRVDNSTPLYLWYG